MKYHRAVTHDAEMMRFLYERTGLDLRGQDLDSHRWISVTVRSPYSHDVVAALVCEFRAPWECTFTAAIDDPEAINRKFLSEIFQALFSRVRRITAHVEPSNTHCEDIVRRLGFVYEGFCRRGYDGERDALVYGMLAEDCKFLTGVRAARSNGGGPDAPTRPTGPLSAGVGTAERKRGIGGGERYH